MIQATSYKAAMHEAHKARQKRLWPKPAANSNEQTPVVQILQPAGIVSRWPEWKKGRIAFDFHVWLFVEYRFEQMKTLRAYIRQRCEELGVDYKEVTGPSRFRRVVKPRQLIMWEIKTQLRPAISYPEIGRLFGGRDHTTVLAAVRSVQGMKDRGEMDAHWRTVE